MEREPKPKEEKILEAIIFFSTGTASWSVSMHETIYRTSYMGKMRQRDRWSGFLKQ